MVWGNRIAPPFPNWRPIPPVRFLPPQSLIAKRPDKRPTPSWRHLPRIANPQLPFPYSNPVGRAYVPRTRADRARYGVIQRYYRRADRNRIWDYLGNTGRAARQSYYNYLTHLSRYFRYGRTVKPRYY